MVPPLIRRLSPLGITNLTPIRALSGGTNGVVEGRAPPRLQRPSPGRLSRAPRDAAPSVEIKATNHEADRAKNSRIEERKRAIERRRLLLEKGITPSAEAALQEEHKPGDDHKVEGAITLESNTQSSTVTNPPRIARSSVHSLNEGRKLSAADLHRLQRSTQRTEVMMQKSQQSVHQTFPIVQNKVERRIQRKDRMDTSGGSVVASQSATTRYRLQRLQQTNLVGTGSECNLKTNPAVISIPLNENDSAPAVVDDFEERLKKLRKVKQKEESSGWFSWLWKK
jgi:hypothetical protein